MKEFKDKVAVITGGANGLGLEIAKEAVRRGMKVVIGDCDQKAMDEADKILASMDADYLILPMDVTVFEDMEKLAKAALDKYKHVDLFFNNAGVAVGGALWELPIKDLDYVIQSNLYSVCYGLKVFIPLMEAQGTPAHIVNTASVAGLVVASGMPSYFMTKHANVALSESTYYQLQERGSNIQMSVYCPGYVQTDLHNCQFKRPQRFSMDMEDPYYQSEAFKMGLATAKHVIETGIPADSVGMMVFQAIEDEKFYILTHPQYLPIAGMRVKGILEGKNPDIHFLKR